MKVLVLRFSSIGDIVLTTPVVRGLKQQANAVVHYLSKAAFEPILRPNPYIDQVFSFNKEVSEVLPALKAERYDVVIDLHNNLRSRWVKWQLGRPAYTFDKLNIEKWLLVNFGWNRLPDMHIVDRYMASAASLGVHYDGKGLDFFIPEGLGWQHSQQVDNMPSQPYIAFVLGATHATKRLPQEKIIDICNQLQQPLVLLGGKDEAESAIQVTQKTGAHVINMCGKLSLYESASVVRDAALVLTHDTGLMHIAAAFRKKIVSVWGNTIPAFGMYPLYPDGIQLNTTIEVSGLPCRPCSKIGYSKCPKGHFACMKSISTEQIISQISP